MLKRGNVYGDYSGYGKASQPKDMLDGASRFFYVAKASRAERNMGLDGFPEKDAGRWNKAGKWTDDTTPTKNDHPTCKPLKLMEYLVKLVTPPNGTVLDPFLGSGTTAIACKKLGFNYIGIEQDEHYCKIAEARIAAVQKPLL